MEGMCDKTELLSGQEARENGLRSYCPLRGHTPSDLKTSRRPISQRFLPVVPC